MGWDTSSSTLNNGRWAAGIACGVRYLAFAMWIWVESVNGCPSNE